MCQVYVWREQCLFPEMLNAALLYIFPFFVEFLINMLFACLNANTHIIWD